MSNVEKISVSLPREMIETIEQAVELGEYATTSEVIRDAIRRWADEHVYQRAIKTYGIENLRRTIKEATDSLDRGEGIPAEELYAELTARHNGKAKRKRSA